MTLYLDNTRSLSTRTTRFVAPLLNWAPLQLGSRESILTRLLPIYEEANQKWPHSSASGPLSFSAAFSWRRAERLRGGRREKLDTIMIGSIGAARQTRQPLDTLFRQPGG